MERTRSNSIQLPQGNSLSLKVLGTPPPTDRHGPLKVAAFDLDHTLIVSKSGAVHPQNEEDWQFRFLEVPDVLKALEDSGYFILIVTNQLGLSQGHAEFALFKTVVEDFLRECDISALVLVATEDDEYRKPAIGAWEHFGEILAQSSWRGDEVSLGRRGVLKEVGGGDPRLSNLPQLSKKRQEKARTHNKFTVSSIYLPFDPFREFALRLDVTKDSFFCGDAAGRFDEDRIDFSESDLLFAANINLNFVLPEQVFKHAYFKPLTEAPRFRFPEPIVKDPSAFKNTLKLDLVQQSYRSGLLVLLVGPPGCGKSHFARTYLNNLTTVSYVS